MVNFGPLAPEIVSLVWGTPANFNNFRDLALLLQRRHSTEANQTLHNVWPSPGLVYYIYIYVIPNKECVPKHKLLVMDMRFNTTTRHRASTSMYSLTFRVRVITPPQYGQNGTAHAAGMSILSPARGVNLRRHA